MVLKFLGQALALRGSRMCTINTGTGYSGDNVGTTYLRMHRTNRSLGVCSYQRCRRRKTCSSRSRCHGDRTSRMRRAGMGALTPAPPRPLQLRHIPPPGTDALSRSTSRRCFSTHAACSSWGSADMAVREMCSLWKWPLSPNRRPQPPPRKKKAPIKHPPQ